MRESPCTSDLTHFRHALFVPLEQKSQSSERTTKWPAIISKRITQSWRIPKWLVATAGVAISKKSTFFFRTDTCSLRTESKFGRCYLLFSGIHLTPVLQSSTPCWAGTSMNQFAKRQPSHLENYSKRWCDISSFILQASKSIQRHIQRKSSQNLLFLFRVSETVYSRIQVFPDSLSHNFKLTSKSTSILGQVRTRTTSETSFNQEAPFIMWSTTSFFTRLYISNLPSTHSSIAFQPSFMYKENCTDRCKSHQLAQRSESECPLYRVLAGAPIARPKLMTSNLVMVIVAHGCHQERCFHWPNHSQSVQMDHASDKYW